jgi:UDP-GlcNAc:undecaprenyl-phosphate GlcNAc-1-phosphate transferase
MLKYVILFGLAFLCSLALTPLVRSMALRLRALDLPNWRKVHDHPIPRLGGLSIVVSFALVLYQASRVDYFYFHPALMEDANLFWLIVAGTIMFLMGAVDDFRRLSAAVKFFIQVGAALLVAHTSYQIEVLSLPFGEYPLGIWAIPVTVLWIVAITNALNLLDGLDGLAGGISFIIALSMFGIAVLTQNIGVGLISMTLAGSILGFLRYNFHPASIFLGNSGAYTLGFVLSLLSLQSNLKGTTAVIFLIPMLLLGLPIMDTALSMTRRLLKSLHILGEDEKRNLLKFFFLNGKSLFKADRDHIHHRLLQMGFTQQNAVALLYAITLLLGIVAFASVYFRDMNQALLIASIAIASFIGIKRLGYSEIQFLRNGSLLPLFELSLVSWRMVKVFLDIVFITLSYYLAFLLRFEGDLTPQVKGYLLSTIPLILAVKISVFFLTGLYQGIFRYINVDDLLKILKATFLGNLVTVFVLWMVPSWGVMSWAVLVIDFNLLFLLIAGTRSSFRILEHLHLANNHEGKKILLYGLGKNSVHALNELINNPRLGLRPVGFIDDDPRNQEDFVSGIPVLGNLDSLEKILGEYSISEVIISDVDFPPEKLDRLMEICGPRQVSLRRFQAKLEEIPSSSSLRSDPFPSSPSFSLKEPMMNYPLRKEM